MSGLHFHLSLGHEENVLFTIKKNFLMAHQGAWQRDPHSLGWFSAVAPLPQFSAGVKQFSATAMADFFHLDA
jgi:hypothetical protein